MYLIRICKWRRAFPFDLPIFYIYIYIFISISIPLFSISSIFIHPSIYLSSYLSIYLPISLYISLNIYLIYLSIYPSIYVSISLHLPIFISMRQIHIKILFSGQKQSSFLSLDFFVYQGLRSRRAPAFTRGRKSLRGGPRARRHRVSTCRSQPDTTPNSKTKIECAVHSAL
jgi:hypothetical protein